MDRTKNIRGTIYPKAEAQPRKIDITRVLVWTIFIQTSILFVGIIVLLYTNF